MAQQNAKKDLLTQIKDAAKHTPTEVYRYLKIIDNYRRSHLTSDPSPWRFDETHEKAHIKQLSAAEENNLMKRLNMEKPPQITLENLEKHITEYLTERTKIISNHGAAIDDTHIKKLQDYFASAKKSDITIEDLNQHIKKAINSIESQHQTDETALKPNEEKLKQLKTIQEKFYTDVANDLENQYREMQKLRDRMAILARLANDPANHEQFRQLIAEAQAKKNVNNSSAISVTQSSNTLDYSEITPDMLNVFNIKTQSGLEIIVDRNDKNIKCTLKLPSRNICPWGIREIGQLIGYDLGQSFYYHSMQDNVKTDLLESAKLIKAEGHKSITSDITHGNHDYALQVAQVVYEANRIAGFDAKNITIRVNGKVIPIDEETNEKDPEKTAPGLFKKVEAGVKENIEQRARESIYVDEKFRGNSVIKKSIQELRKKSAPEPQDEKKTTPTPTPGK